MLRISLRNLLSHKGRFAMTTLAVVIGVGFVVGSFVVTDSLRRSVDQLLTQVTSGTDVSVRATTNLTGATAVRTRIPVDLLDTVRQVDGVAEAEVNIGGYAQLLDKDGEPMTTTGAPFLGVSWGHVGALRPATMQSGRAPSGTGEVAIDRGTAEDYGFSIGDRTRVLLASGDSPTVTVVGIFTFGEANNLLGARITAFDVDVASQLLGVAGQVDAIDVVADPGSDLAALTDRIQQVLPAGTEAVTSETVVDESSAGLAGFMGAFQNILLGFAAIALFVSAFFINNTFSIVVGQRTRQLALLRSLGASPRQITRSVVAEALVVGVLASGIGIAFGLLIARVLQAIFSAAGFGLPTAGLVLSSRTIAAAVVVGIGVTLLAAIAPARRASSVPPVQGMREGFVATGWSRGRRIVSGVVLSVAGVAFVTAGLFAADATMSLVGLLAAGGFAVFAGIALLSPVVAVPVAGTLGRPVAGLIRVAGRLAHLNAVRNPDRTATTAAALMIGLALVTTVFTVGTSMKETFASSMERSVSADYVLSTNGSTGFSPALTADLATVPGVEAITGVRFGDFVFEGHQRSVVAVDPVPAGQVIDIDIRSGTLSALDDRSIFIHVDPARDLGLAVGDRVTVGFASGGSRQLTVAGTYADSTYAGNYLIDIGLFAREYPTRNLDLFAFVRLADGADPVATRSAIDAVVASQPQVKLEDRAEYQAGQQAQFDSVLIAINGLLGLALFIALLGIANTLALSVLERTREIGLLRAVGM